MTAINRMVVRHGGFLYTGGGPENSFDTHDAAWLDAMRTRPTRVDLEHVRSGAGHAPWLVVQRGDLLQDTGDGAVARDEHHVERDARIVHPERARLLVVPREQHALR